MVAVKNEVWVNFSSIVLAHIQKLKNTRQHGVSSRLQPQFLFGDRESLNQGSMEHCCFIRFVNRCGLGRRDRPSQLACCPVSLNSMLYEKAPKKRHQRWILAAVVADTAFPGSMMYLRG